VSVVVFKGCQEAVSAGVGPAACDRLLKRGQRVGKCPARNIACLKAAIEDEIGVGRRRGSRYLAHSVGVRCALACIAAIQ
jgi:hypothetical protein